MAALLISANRIIDFYSLGKQRSYPQDTDMSLSLLIGENAPLTKLPKNFPTEIDETLALGLDLGVGSCGQALVYDHEKDKSSCKIEMHRLKGDDRLPVNFPNRIAFLGVRAFDIPETKEKSGVKLKNPTRREKRHLRKTTRRRAWRMWEVRKLLKEHKLLPADYPTDPSTWKLKPGQTTDPAVRKWSIWHAQMTEGLNGRLGPLELRVKGLDQKLEPLEFATALLHLAKHRGFRSNRKTDSVDEEGGEVLTALGENRERMSTGTYRTVGEMLLKHPDFEARKRNRSGSYTATLQRRDQLAEIEILFKKQRQLGNTFATELLESSYIPIFFDQYPLQNSLKLLGDCPFEKTEKRGPRLSPSFELCRALQRLNVLSVRHPNGSVEPFPDFLSASADGYKPFVDTFGHTKKITYKTLRKIFALPRGIQFEDLPLEPVALEPNATEEERDKAATQQINKAEGKDFVSRTGNAAEGTYLLRNALGPDLWDKYTSSHPEYLDHLAFALSFFEEIENNRDTRDHWGVIDELKHANIPKDLIQAVADDLNPALGKPTLAKFSGSTSTSTKASRKLIPLLTKGLMYSEACTKIYGEHRQSDDSFQNITNPVVQSVVRETIKQVVHLINETGALPGRINLEIGRDLGKSVDERNRIDREIKKRTAEKARNTIRFKEQYFSDPSDSEILAYELYLEQSGLCPYTGKSLPNPHTWRRHPLDIDHILPRSRSHDNSYDNKVLVHPSANRNKSNQTPSEWLGTDTEAWKTLNSAISHMPRLRPRKRRNLLNTTFAQDEAKFASRHLNDTRYISRLVTKYLSALYQIAGEKPSTEKGSSRRVFVQPGALTSLVRKSWGLEDLKKDRDGRRLGDKHHAVDALICALLSEGQRQFITKQEQNKQAARHAPIFSDFSRSYEVMEQKNDPCRTPRHVSPPWREFRTDVVSALELFTVSRCENRRGRGSLHNDTLYRVEYENDKQIAYSRKPIIDSSTGKPRAILNKLTDLDKVKDINLDRNLWLKNTLTQWITDGSPTEEDRLPRDPQGAIIRKLTIKQGKKSGRHYPQGFVTGGDQIRVDVFSKPNRKGDKVFYLVPIYSYHLIQRNPPMRAIVAAKDESEWVEMDKSYEFQFSLWPNSRLELKKKPTPKKPEAQHTEGLYSGVDRNTGSFVATAPDDSQNQTQLTAKTGTLLFRKLETDRLGRVFPVKSEKRTWRGKIVD